MSSGDGYRTGQSLQAVVVAVVSAGIQIVGLVHGRSFLLDARGWVDLGSAGIFGLLPVVLLLLRASSEPLPGLRTFMRLLALAMGMLTTWSLFFAR